MRISPMSGALVLFATMATLGGCVDNDVSLTISRFIPPDPASLTSGMCKFDPTVTVNQTRGSYDLAMANVIHSGYYANFVVSNNLQPLSGVRIDTQDYSVSSFDVVLDVTGPITQVIPPSARSFNYKSGTIRLLPGGLAAANAQVIDPQYVAQMIALKVDQPGTILAHIRAVATRGENQIVSAYSDLPIDVCNDCLTGAAKGFPACPVPSPTPLEGNACNPAQDFAIQCCNAASGGSVSLLCGADAKPSST